MLGKNSLSLVLIERVATDYNSFLQRYVSEKGLKVKIDHKIF